MRRLLIIILAAFMLIGCAHTYRTAVTAELQRGKLYFKEGYYKRAMRILLPFACDGVPEAEYAIGYMYYYGYGVSQDTEVGRFWIERAAACGNKAAQKALALIDCQENERIVRPSCHESLKSKKALENR